MSHQIYLKDNVKTKKKKKKKKESKSRLETPQTSNSNKRISERFILVKIWIYLI